MPSETPGGPAGDLGIEELAQGNGDPAGDRALPGAPEAFHRLMVGYGTLGVACELEVRSSLGFAALMLFVHVEAHLLLPKLADLTLCRSIQLLALLGRGDASKDLEILILRHQLSVVRRQVPRPRLEPADRAPLAAASRVPPQSAGRAASSSPTRCCVGIGGWSPARGPTLVDRDDRHWISRPSS